MLTRICLDDPGTAATLEASAAGGHRARRARPDGDGRAVPLDAPRAAGSSTCSTPTRRSSRSTSPPGSARSSAHTWLKLPVVDELERVMDATTLPTLLLGGDPQGDPHDTYAVVGHGARPAGRARPGRRAGPALPAGRRRRRGRRHRRRARPREPGRDERQRTLGAARSGSAAARRLGRRRRRHRRRAGSTPACMPWRWLPGSSATVAAGELGAHRRARSPVRSRSRASTRTARRTRPRSPAATSVFAGPTDVAYVPRGTRELDGDRRAAARRRVAVCGAPRGASGTRRRSGTWPPPTCRSSCAAPGTRRARSATSASPACSTPTRSSPARWSPRRATGAPTRRTSTTRSAPGVETELEEIYYFEVQAEPPAAPDRAAPIPVGYQRVYGTDERPIDVLAEVRTGRRRPRAARLARPGDGGARLRPLLPQRHGRPGRRAGLADLRRPAHGWVRDTWDDAGRRPPTSPRRRSMTSDARPSGSPWPRPWCGSSPTSGASATASGRSCSPAASASSATATSPASGRRCCRTSCADRRATRLPYVLARNEQAMVHTVGRATPGRRTGSRPGRAPPRSARARPTC